MSGGVLLVGIGPGHPGLLTVQAREAIAGAGAVRHPEGVSPAILGLARPGSDVRQFRGPAEVVRLARAGTSVAVLFPGDPYVFAGGGALAEQLAAGGVDFEAVPGLLTETAAPSLSGVPLTVEGRSSSIGIGVVAGADTVVLRLSPGLWETGVKRLIDAGHDAGRSAAFIVNPGGPGQRRIVAPLGELLAVAAERGLEGEALLVSGPGVEMSRMLDTLSQRPLHGRRVLVTRASHQADGFRRQLSELGALVIEVPTIEVRAIPDLEASREAIRRLPDTGLVIFTSANAVDIFFRLLAGERRDARSLASSRVCAIGPETSRSLEEHSIIPELVAGEYTAEGLAAALAGWDLQGERVLVPRARMGRDALPALLAQRGAEVEILPVYETVCPESSSRLLRALFADGPLDAVTFTSSSTVANFVKAFPDGLPAAVRETAVACMGPVTADTARRLGLAVDIIAREYTTRGLALAVAEALGGFRPPSGDNLG